MVWLSLLSGDGLWWERLMKATLLLAVVFIFSLFFIGSVHAATTWHSESFGGKLTVNEPEATVTWHSSPFGGKLTVNEPEATVTWHSSPFGGKLTVGLAIDIDVSPDIWAVGSPNCAESSQNNFTFYQNGSSTIDVKIGFNDTNYTYVNWSTYSNNGYDQYTANFTTDSWSSETNIDPKSGSDPVTTLKASVTGESNFTFGIRLWMPKSVSIPDILEDFDILLRGTIP